MFEKAFSANFTEELSTDSLELLDDGNPKLTSLAKEAFEAGYFSSLQTVLEHSEVLADCLRDETDEYSRSAGKRGQDYSLELDTYDKFRLYYKDELDKSWQNWLKEKS